MQPDEPTDEEKLEQLPEDHQTPFQPAQADDASGPTSDPDAYLPEIDDTHPNTDSGLQPEEMYDEGIANAADSGQPTPGAGAAELTDDELQSGFSDEPDNDTRPA
jgi:hypothetical protein